MGNFLCCCVWDTDGDSNCCSKKSPEEEKLLQTNRRLLEIESKSEEERARLQRENQKLLRIYRESQQSAAADLETAKNELADALRKKSGLAQQYEKRGKENKKLQEVIANLEQQYEARGQKCKKLEEIVNQLKKQIANYENAVNVRAVEGTIRVTPGGALEPFNVILIGEVGEGKSSLTMALSGDTNILVKNKAAGVTKKINMYHILPEIMQEAYVFDGPGVGDQDADLNDLLDNLANICGSNVVHCVVFAIDMSKGRLTLGSRVCLIMIQKGFIKSYDHVIICGTKKDKMEDEYSIIEWREAIAEHVALEAFGGISNVGGICTVGLDMQRKQHEKSEFEFVSRDIDELVTAMKRIRELGTHAEYDMKFDISEMIKEASELLNLELRDDEIEEIQREFALRRAMYEKSRQQKATTI